MLGPNIYGTIRTAKECVFEYASGAFYTDTNEARAQASAVSTGDRAVHLNAHNSNSVYTDSGKVYPLSLALNFIIKS